jgi:hypothetical protein
MARKANTTILNNCRVSISVVPESGLQFALIAAQPKRTRIKAKAGCHIICRDALEIDQMTRAVLDMTAIRE